MEEYINYGIITLLPPIIVIAFAVITKRTFEALILGGVAAYIITTGLGFFPAYIDAVFQVLTNYDSVWLILVCGLFGSLIALLEKSKGTIGFSKFIAKYADSPKKTLMASYIMGILIFVDDYLNVLAIGSSMKRLSDEQKVPREMLAYIVASTGASDCTVIPFSTWVVFYAGLFAAIPELAAYGAIDTGMGMYYHMIPTIFYGWTCLLVVPLVILGVIPIFGPMKKAYDRVATTGMVYSLDSAKYNEDKEEDVEGGNLWFFAAPILLLIAVTINQNDLLYGVLAGIGLSMAMILIGRKLKFVEVSDAILTGLGNMIPMLAIIVAALAIKISMDQINLPNYIIEAVLPYMQPALFPALTFILVAGLAFITGSNWGIPAVCVPILMPLALAGDANIILTASAIVSGGVFGSHACFYSDCTVLTSAATKIEVMEHNLTQIPYALISAVLAIILFAVFGIMNWSF